MNKRILHIREWIIKQLLFLCSFISVLTTIGIIYILSLETIEFFQSIGFAPFFFDTEWTPLNTEKHYGIWPLLGGTLLTTFIALAVAVPIGLISAIYLSEYASKRFREITKPLLEILAALPSVVYGYFALLFITPFLKIFIPELSGFNALSAGIAMGIMIIPLVSSLSEDAMHAVPAELREGAYALGSSKIQVAFRIVFPAALSGIMSAIILALSRAIGETMIVAIAAGQQARLTLNPLLPVETITTFIVKITLGDTPQDSLEYKTIFVCGMTLFVITFVLNFLSFYLKKRFREVHQ